VRKGSLHTILRRAYDRGMSTAVELVEVAPRDGLQNEQRVLSTEDKLELVRRSVAAGARRVEVTSFVHPARVPQLADAEDVVAQLPRDDGVVYTALILNERGYDRALAAGVAEICTVVVASETFSRRNQGMSIAETLAALRRIRDRAGTDGVRVTVTVAAAFGCPFEGDLPLAAFEDVLRRTVELGPDELTLADTIGVGVPSDIEERFGLAAALGPGLPLRAHLHDTRNTGVANAVAAVRSGVTALDTSVGGLGGCPFAPAATGNVATEDLVYTLHRMGYETGQRIEPIIDTARWVTGRLGVPIAGSLARAGGFPPAI
jgi:hydroxymethylglutaryl-CoA lyase